MTDEPLLHRAHADLIVERAATQLRELLKTLAAEIDPFPPFPGAMFAYGIEVEPPVGSGDQYGCVILAEDGDLYELKIGVDVEQATSGAGVAVRSEDRVSLDDLPPAEYAGYAHRAVTAAVEYLLSQQD
ncbi:MAG TPA: hypothetical protein QGI71_00790 [Dehalococcoidia bacterium]|jgi:hypothetical protein|nr:hypothetical protein [Dehalococcoidia bacterium]